MFDGFDPEKYADEARAKWGATDSFKESARRTKSYGKAEWDAIKSEADGSSPVRGADAGGRSADAMRACVASSRRIARTSIAGSIRARWRCSRASRRCTSRTRGSPRTSTSTAGASLGSSTPPSQGSQKSRGYSVNSVVVLPTAGMQVVLIRGELLRVADHEVDRRGIEPGRSPAAPCRRPPASACTASCARSGALALREHARAKRAHHVGRLTVDEVRGHRRGAALVAVRDPRSNAPAIA